MCGATLLHARLHCQGAAHRYCPAGDQKWYNSAVFIRDELARGDNQNMQHSRYHNCRASVGHALSGDGTQRMPPSLNHHCNCDVRRHKYWTGACRTAVARVLS